MKKLASVLFTVALLAGCKQAADSKAEAERLMELSREWSRSAAARDLEKTLSFWADDAMVISAGERTRKGKDAIRKMVESSYKNTSFQISWEPQQAEVSQSGDLGYLIEETRITTHDSTGKPVTKFYNSATVWKKQADGSWKNILDIIMPKAE